MSIQDKSEFGRSLLKSSATLGGVTESCLPQIIKEIKLIHESYFKTRKQLLFTFLLIDIRHDLQKIDLEFMKYLNSMMCPFVIVFTKSDKIKSDLVSEKIKLYKDSLLSYWEDLPDTFVTSAWNSKGVDEILEFVNQSIKKYTI